MKATMVAKSGAGSTATTAVEGAVAMTEQIGHNKNPNNNVAMKQY